MPAKQTAASASPPGQLTEGAPGRQEPSSAAGTSRGRRSIILWASFVFTPKQTGTLFLYVNDAINALGLPIDVGNGATSHAWNAAYLNNKGKATVTIAWRGGG